MANGFLYSTEMVALVLGLLVFFFIKNNEPKRTIQFKICVYGMNILIIKLVLEMLFQTYIHLAEIYQTDIINLYTVNIWILHLSMANLLVVYILRMSDFSFNLKKYAIITVSYMVVALSVGVYLLQRGVLYSISDGHFKIHYLFSYIEAASLVVLIALYILTVRFREHYPRPLFRYIAYCVPFIMCFQLLQIWQGEILFSGIIYMIPFLVFYFLYHNDVYDQKTGGRSINSLEGFLESLKKNNRDYMVLYVRPDENQFEINKLGNRIFEVYFKFCRLSEYVDRKVHVFIVDNMTVLLITAKDEKKRIEIRDKIKENVYEHLGNYLDAITPTVYEITNNEYTEKYQDIRTLVEFFHAREDHIKQIDWRRIDQDDLLRYGHDREIRKLIRDIDEQADLSNNSVVCYAQPIYDLKRQKYTKAEALLRIRVDNSLRFIPPVEVIPIAEEVGCIHILTLTMVNKVCAFIEKNESKYDFESISVNCSVAELQNPHFYDDVKQILLNHGVKPSMIKMELTETTTNSDINLDNVFIENIVRLKEFGIGFYLDDYGTGYSNLSRLLSMNYNAIKFDKSLLYKSMEDANTLDMIDSMIKLFKKKNSSVLVEGVETEDQLELVKEHGFDYVQGFYFAMPVPIEKLVEYFDRK